MSYRKDKYIKKVNRRMNELSLTESDENVSMELKAYLRKYIKTLNDLKIEHQKRLISDLNKDKVISPALQKKECIVTVFKISPAKLVLIKR